MTHSPNKPHSDPPENSRPSTDKQEFGYGKPPKHSQFRKGQSGNPAGRPKAPIGVSIKEILDGDQIGKNGEVISGREATVVRILNDALAGNQKAFGRFLDLLSRSGLKRSEPSSQVTHIFYEAKPMTPEEHEKFKRNFGLPEDQWT